MSSTRQRYVTGIWLALLSIPFFLAGSVWGGVILALMGAAGIIRAVVGGPSALEVAASSDEAFVHQVFRQAVITSGLAVAMVAATVLGGLGYIGPDDEGGPELMVILGMVATVLTSYIAVRTVQYYRDLRRDPSLVRSKRDEVK